MSMTVFILGGYGVFGGRLAKRLIQETDHTVIIAGRSRSKAEAFCAENGGTSQVADRDDVVSLRQALSRAEPDIVVDASGPFDFDGTIKSYRVASCALEVGAHYIDLADNADFVSNISMLDLAARAANRCVLSGVSSVPCLSSAAVEALSADMQSIDEIDMAIIPGNRAPRGKAVVESILYQAGKPFGQWENGKWRRRHCWSSLRTTTLNLPNCGPIKNRLISPIEVPDQRLFPSHFQANSVRFSAGLELRTMHLGLWGLTGLVHLRVMKSLRPLAGLMHRVATWFEPLGSDRGGMYVDVSGRLSSGENVKRRWTLIAEEGDGPQVPATPARAMIDALLDGSIGSGARPAVGTLRLDAIEKHFATFAIKTGTKESSLHLPDDHAPRRVSRAKRADHAGVVAA